MCFSTIFILNTNLLYLEEKSRILKMVVLIKYGIKSLSELGSIFAGVVALISILNFFISQIQNLSLKAKVVFLVIAGIAVIFLLKMVWKSLLSIRGQIATAQIEDEIGKIEKKRFS